MRRVVLATMMASLASCVDAVFGEPSGSIPFEAALKDANVTLSSLNSGQSEGLILGNGDLYGIVWEKDGGLTMRVTKNDIWDARIDTSQDPPLPKVNIRNSTVSGTTGAPPSYGHPYPQPRCAAALRLGSIVPQNNLSENGGKAATQLPTTASVRAVLDLRHAVATVTRSEQSATKIRVVADRNVVLIDSPEAVILEPISAETLPDAQTGKTDGIAWLHAKLPGDLDYQGMQYALAVASRGSRKAVSVVTSCDIKSGDVRQSAIALAKQTLLEEEADLIERHERSWHEFWSRSGIANCPFDIAYVHYTFEAFIRASSELGKDRKLASQCRIMKDLLADYPVAFNADGKPVVVDWEGCKYKEVDVHNVTVPAAPVFPAEQVTWFSPEPDKALFRRTIEDTRFNGNNSHVMFNIAKARLSMPEAVTASRTWFKSRELPNGLFVWKGHAHGTFMAESVGVVALITEFLMQSVDDTIRVFPCWPQDQDAAFTDLRAQGGFLVTAEWKDRDVVRLKITSSVGGTLRLVSPWKTITVNGEALTPDGHGIVSFETKAGEAMAFSNQ